MDPWPFIIGAYALGVGATAALILWSFVGMRRAEREADSLRGRE